ncbi:MAG: hypothetical protein F4010_06965 [Cenarchaeum sp. SB0669_bin_11]|nr:hypothetical protein [Cenarchaeum sp. SB0669_bin_11]
MCTWKISSHRVDHSIYLRCFVSFGAGARVVARYPSIEDMPTTHDVTYGIKAAQDILHMIKNDIKRST